MRVTSFSGVTLVILREEVEEEGGGVKGGEEKRGEGGGVKAEEEEGVEENENSSSEDEEEYVAPWPKIHIPIPEMTEDPKIWTLDRNLVPNIFSLKFVLFTRHGKLKESQDLKICQEYRVYYDKKELGDWDSLPKDTGKDLTCVPVFNDIFPAPHSFQLYLVELLLQLREKYQAGFGQDTIIRHQGFRLEMVETTHIDWDMGLLSGYQCLTLEFLQEHSDWKWDVNVLSGNSKLPFEVLDIFPMWPWNMHFLSRNSGLTMDLVMKHPKLKWHVHSLLTHVNFDPKLLTLPLNFKIKAMKAVQRRNDFNMEWVRQYPHHKWAADMLLRHRDFSMEIVELLPHRAWNVNRLSKHPSITIDIVRKFPMWKWVPTSFPKEVRDQLRVEDFQNEKCIAILSMCPDLDLEFVRAHPTWKWNMNILSCHKDLTFEFILDLCHKEIDIYGAHD